MFFKWLRKCPKIHTVVPYSQNQIWAYIAEKLELGLLTEERKSEEDVESFQDERQKKFDFMADAQYIKGKVGTSVTKTSASSKKRSKQGVYRRNGISEKDTVLIHLEKNPDIALIFDDIHLLQKNIRRNIVKSVKPIVQSGIKIIFILIPSRENDDGAEYNEINNRVAIIHFEKWSTEDLKKIARQGFGKFNIELSEDSMTSMSEEAKGNPQLMQEFCKELSYDLLEAGDFVSGTTSMPDKKILNKIYRKIATKTGMPITQQISTLGRKGKRKKYTLKNNNCAEKDIYELVLDALSSMSSKSDKYENHILRETVNNFLKPTQKVMMSQITHVIKSLSNLYSEKEGNSSCKIIDFAPEQHCFYIIDPFFSFYLKWGRDS